jgi:hypothetical protein
VKNIYSHTHEANQDTYILPMNNFLTIQVALGKKNQKEKDDSHGGATGELI